MSDGTASHSGHRPGPDTGETAEPHPRPTAEPRPPRAGRQPPLTRLADSRRSDHKEERVLGEKQCDSPAAAITDPTGCSTTNQEIVLLAVAQLVNCYLFYNLFHNKKTVKVTGVASKSRLATKNNESALCLKHNEGTGFF